MAQLGAPVCRHFPDPLWSVEFLQLARGLLALALPRPAHPCTQPGYPAVLGIAACIPPWVACSFATLLDSTWHPIHICPWSTALQEHWDPTYRTLCKAYWRIVLGASSCACCTTCNPAGCSAPAIVNFFIFDFYLHQCRLLSFWTS